MTIANNGAEALERLAEGEFDAVLMDCQMPVMDGFTATRRIRETEREAGLGKRLPIIALTANVMSEDREHCIAAGMDAHLGKPIVASQLVDCLGRYLGGSKARHEVDLEALLELTGGDVDFERELIATFIESGDKCLAEIIAALKANDFETIGKRAHALKGASANIHAHRLAAAASHAGDRGARQCSERDQRAGTPGDRESQRSQCAIAQGRLIESSRVPRDRQDRRDLPTVGAVAPRLLAAVQALIRRPNQRLERERQIGPVRPRGCDAEARRHHGVAATRRERRCGHHQAHLLRDEHRAVVPVSGSTMRNSSPP